MKRTLNFYRAVGAVVPSFGFLLAYTEARVPGLAPDEDTESGVGSIEWLILIAIGVTIAVAVGVILYQKFTDKANCISTSSTVTGAAPAPGAGCS